MRPRNVVIGLIAVVVVVGVAAESIVDPVHIGHKTPVALAPGKVSLVGDSLNLGVETYLGVELAGRTNEVDDVVGRGTEAGIEHLRGKGAGLGRYVVVSLGTNDPSDGSAAFRDHVAAVLRLAGTRCVVWATIHRDGDAYEPFNAVLRDAARVDRNLRLVEWTEMVAAHPEWLAGDGIHGTPEGYRARAAAIVAAMRTCPARA